MKNIKTMLQKRLKAAKNKKGFTLIEIIVVLVIMAVLLALTVPAITSYIEEANNAKYYTEARSVYVVAEAERARALATTGTALTSFTGTDLDKIKDNSGVDVTAVTYTAATAAVDGGAAASDAYYTITFGDGAVVKVTVNGSMELTK